MNQIRDRYQGAIVWQADHLALLDQRLLPQRVHYVTCTDADAVAEAIRSMVVRGAPAIGIAAAYGVALAARAAHGQAEPHATITAAIEHLSVSRPTAVNLHWAMARMTRLLATLSADDDWPQRLLREAEAIHHEDIDANQAMAQHGLAVVRQTNFSGTIWMTHCNTGSLATGGYGTALGVIRAAHAAGLVDTVFAGETRPWLQGARLTAWELQQDNIPVTLHADSAAAHIMQTHRPAWVVVGADRITANGDVANKIGTYGLAVLARQHGVGFMVVAPTSTVDMALPSGDAIPIEERGADELTHWQGAAIAPAHVNAFNPVFDVTPAGLIDAIVTEQGSVLQPDAAGMARLMGDQGLS